MAVYYKFKSEKNCGSISMIDRFISVSSIKRRIFESRYVQMGFDLDVEISNAQTKEVYLDEATLIPNNTSVLVRRIPRHSRMRFVPRHYELKAESNLHDNLPMNTAITQDNISTMKDVEPLELDDGFGDDIYVSAPEFKAKNAVIIDHASIKNKEDLKIKALVATPSLSWKDDERFGRMMGGTSFECRKPPQGYVCHRCNKPGHLIQRCPTNGDPNYDIKNCKPPTGIPKTMLIANPEGSYVKPDEASFEKEIDRVPTSCHSLGDLPPELYCLLCKQVMKDAVLTSKCCFNSFCDKCMRDYIISKSVCVCGAKHIVADDLIPNKTLRDTIIRILESSSSSRSNNNARSGSQLQDMTSTRSSQTKSASPTQSVASKGVDPPPPPTQSADPSQSSAQRASDESKTDKVPDVSEATHEVKKKKARLGVAETSPYFAANRFKMPNYVSAYGYNSRWTGFQPGTEGYMGYGSTPMVTNARFSLYHMLPPQRDNASFISSKTSHEQEHVCSKKRKLSSKSKPSDNPYKRKRSSECPSPITRELAVL